MKIRNGFVSNSSTSSFIVQIKKDHPVFYTGEENPFLASGEDIEKLKEYGFEESNSLSPFNLEQNQSFDGYEGPLSMSLFLTCNQDEAVYFLVKNNIPFKASCHYDCYFMSYKKDSDYILVANNFGIELDMYGEDEYEFEEIVQRKSFEKIKKQKWLKEQREWRKENI